ncbi:Arachidonate 12-lipoxygenase [Nibea albiflora]|uniref:Arachidonate 12-lipoxygenase n=1 Tax=Nibea albiflora TaxID=240163 RepID=A0ACB7FBQ4_NIBAL|nr:Arachidonate 12-lipoxygenase [Nibea albiflora]
MFPFVCGQSFRRDQFSSHFTNVHGDIHAGLNGWMEHRCPLAYYGCTFSQRRFYPSTRGAKVVHDRNLRSFGVQPCPRAKLPSDSQSDQFSGLPIEILWHIAGFLDSFSLCQLSLVSRTMREVCASLLQTRGIVDLQWERRPCPGAPGTVSWQIKNRMAVQGGNSVVERWKRWEKNGDGASYIPHIKDLKALSADISFSFLKAFQFKHIGELILAELNMKNLTDEPWESFEAMKGFSWLKKSPFLDYMFQHWKDDDFYGYQFLNGPNPNMIQRCSKLPSNFPVTEEMVKPFLANGSSLTAEIKKGNIFIINYKIMEDLPQKLDGERAPLAPVFCLLYLNPEKKLLPIAIQLGQKPSAETPIFLPSDLESDWLLAKMHVKQADALYSQIIAHLQNTHLLSEVFAMATLRNLPKIHPLYKFSLEDITKELLRKALSQTTYSSLCLPENIAARGLESIPNFYYRDDALRLWSIINSFVEAVVAYYYPSDSEVSADSELQEWANEIYYYGFLGNDDSGIPSSFQTVEELIKFVTMVIFTSSVQHAAVNNPQVPLGIYPQQRFDEPAVLQMIKDFQAELSSLSVAITKRNSELELPYYYLNPKEIENSITQ